MKTETNNITIAQLVDNLEVGGAEQLAIRIANGFTARGNKVYLYVLRGTGPLKERTSPDVTIRVLNIHRHSIKNPFKFLVSLIRGYKSLSKQLKIDNVSVLQSHLDNSNYWTLLLALFGPIKGFPTIHNNRVFQNNSTGFISRLWKLSLNLMLSKCGSVIACSEEVRNSIISSLDLKTDPGKKLSAVTNGVDIPESISNEQKLAIFSSYGFTPDEFIVLAAGRLTYQKNFSILIDAAKIVNAENKNIKFIICGEGELRSDLENQIANAGLTETVLLPGNVMNLKEIMQSADLFVLPSKFEGLPLVLLEAMSSGMVAVCSNIAGTADVIVNGKNGILTELDNVQELADSIMQLTDDAPKRLSISKEAVETVRNRYSFNNLLDQLDEIYKG